MTTPGQPGPLRQKILAGGVYLTGRTVIGMALSAGGSVVLLRIMPLREWGLYAVVNLITGFVMSNVLDPGIGPYLIRKPEQPTREDLRTAFSMLAGLGVALAAAVFFAAPWIATWYAEPQIAGLLRISCVSLTLIAVARVSLSLLERELEYKKIAWLELASAATYYAVAIPGAMRGGGALMLVIGDVCRYAVMAGVAVAISRWPMGFHFQREVAQPMLAYCRGYLAALSISALNINGLPLLVGKLLGLEALAVVRVAYGVITQMSMLKAIALRVAGAALAKVQLQKEKLIGAVSEGVFYQLCVVGLPLCAVASQSEWLLPQVYGEKWRAAAPVLLLACFAPLVNSVFAMHTSALYAAGKPAEVARFSLVYTLAVWPAALALMMKFGYLGLPMAEIVALPAYWVLQRAFVKQFGAVNIASHLLMAAAMYAGTLVAAAVQPAWLSSLLYAALAAAFFFVFEPARKIALDLARFLWRRQWAS